MKARLALLWGAIPLACMLFLTDPASAECWTQTNGTQVCGSVPEVLSSGTPVPIDTSHPLPVQVQAGGSAQPVSGTITANQGTAGAAAWKVDGSAVTQPVSGTVTIGAGSASVGSVTSKPTTGTGAYSAATIGTSSAQALAASSAVVFLDIVNASATATIACAFAATAVINGAGSITIPAGYHRSWEGSFVPTDAVNCIASAASTPATIGVK